MKHWWLYVLRLEEGKWYVGITSRTPEIRFKEHKNKVRPAHWTERYKPVGIELTEDLGQMTKGQAERIEHQRTRELMRQEGWQNVRGGRFCSLEYKKRFGILWRVNTENDMPAIELLHALYAVAFLSLVVLYLAISLGVQ